MSLINHSHLNRYCPRLRALVALFVAALLSGCATTQVARPVLVSPQAARFPVSEHILFGYPSAEGHILYREGYVLSHNRQTKIANWASYHLKDSYVVDTVPRSENFKADPDLPKGERAELADYEGGGYDRGHLVPADDMKRNQRTMSESFYLSNMTPQVPGFNRGIWRILESKVQKWAKERKSIYVMTGPIFAESARKTIGPNHVTVPMHYYKIVVSEDNPEKLNAIAFIIPNEGRPSSELPGFITTIDEIERRTGLNFLNELDEVTQRRVESRKAALW